VFINFTASGSYSGSLSLSRSGFPITKSNSSRSGIAGINAQGRICGKQEHPRTEENLAANAITGYDGAAICRNAASDG
ncbi:hypothetical protein OFC05_29795, partial [Escherichia coli]|nr:hypothetical protein [Escherichia coli]